MLDLYTRTAILRLAQQGHSHRTIARTLKLSRNAVRQVLRSGAREVPSLERQELLSAHLDAVRTLYDECRGNFVRVMEKLAERGVAVGYSTLTSFCRRHEIGIAPKQAVGRYHFEAGQEMQHDTSPHNVEIGGVRRTVQCASLVLCYSRAIYAQVYGRFSRFECRAFLTEAVQYFGGAAHRCVTDNTSVVIAHGTGRDAVAADELLALGARFGFSFLAHELGDANRSARVERPFHYIEHNFYPGRSFASLDDLNAQLRAWCDVANAKPKRSLPRPPSELLVAEKSALVPLPLHIPEIYEVHARRVGVEGYVQLHKNLYPVPDLLIGRALQLHEALGEVRIFDGHKLVMRYDKCEYGAGERVPAQPGQHRRGLRTKQPAPSQEEQVLRAQDPALGRLIDALKKRDGGRALKAVRRLHRMYLDYDTELLLSAVREVECYGLTDLMRIEKLVLRRLAGDFFKLPMRDDEHADNNSDDDPDDKDKPS
ncbi:MAG TPA: IS21 family transposase [Polyangiales bacterium]